MQRRVRPTPSRRLIFFIFLFYLAYLITAPHILPALTDLGGQVAERYEDVEAVRRQLCDAIHVVAVTMPFLRRALAEAYNTRRPHAHEARAQDGLHKRKPGRLQKKQPCIKKGIHFCMLHSRRVLVAPPGTQGAGIR